MVVIQLNIRRNRNITAVLNTATVHSFTAIIHNGSTASNVYLAIIVNSRNVIINQIYRCTIFKINVCRIGIVVIIYCQCAIITTVSYFLDVFASASNGKGVASLYLNLTTPKEDTCSTIILHRQIGTVFHNQNIGSIVTTNTNTIAANLCIRIIERQPTSYKSLFHTICDRKSGSNDLNLKVVNSVRNTILVLCTINNNFRISLNIQIGKLFICHQCSIRSVLNCQFRAALYIDGGMIICINTMFLYNAGTAFIQSQYAITTHGNSPLCIFICKDYIGFVKRQRSIDIERMVFGILLRNTNGMTIAVDNHSFFNRTNGQRAIFANLNNFVTLYSFDSCIQSTIRLRTILCNNLRNKRPYRRSRGRSRSRLTAAARAACFALLRSRCGCIVTAAVAVVSGFLYILGVTAAVVSGFLCILVAAVCLNIYIVILSLLNVFTVAYHVYNIIIRGVGCSIVVRTFLRRKRGNRQHGQHHQSGEGTGKKTVISLFHAKNLLCVHTDAKEA